MSKIVISNRSGEQVYEEIDSRTLASIIKGTAIIGIEDSDRSIGIQLTEMLSVRIENLETGALRINVMSTLNADQFPPVRVQLIAAGEEPTAALVEQRLHSLRQLYAISFLLNEGRGAELARFIRDNSGADLEGLLNEQEHLYLQAGGPGTWWLTVLSKIRISGQKALNGLSLVYGEGRIELMKRVRADTRAKEADAAAKETDAAIKRAQLEQEKLKTAQMRKTVIIDTIKQIETLEINTTDKAALKERYVKELILIDHNIQKIVPPEQ